VLKLHVNGDSNAVFHENMQMSEHMIRIITLININHIYRPIFLEQKSAKETVCAGFETTFPCLTLKWNIYTCFLMLNESRKL